VRETGGEGREGEGVGGGCWVFWEEVTKTAKIEQATKLLPVPMSVLPKI